MVSLKASKRGYLALENQEPVRPEEELLIVLDPVLQVRGRVADAATGEPIRRFVAARGTARGDSADWNGGAFSFENGEYHLVFPRPQHLQFVRLEAEGYLPAVSRAFGEREGVQTFDFRLERGKSIAGAVTDGSGRPVAGVEVAVLSSSNPARLVEGKLDGKDGAVRSLTGADGSFSLNPQKDGSGLLVMNTEGAALLDSVDASRPLAITLQPWGRVEGELRLGGKGMAGERILLSGEPVPGRLRFESSATSAGGGRFAFERALPGLARIAHEVNVAPASKRSSFKSTRSQFVNVAPGDTARVLLGGSGRSVIGRLVKSAASTGEADWSAGYASMEEKRVGGPLEPIRYAAPLLPDGSFRLDDIAPGAHWLSILVYDRRFKETGILGQELAALEREIEVQPPGDSPAPQNIGALEVAFNQELAAGAPAPPFTVKTVTGENIRLEDYRGKVVLLDFWATWYGLCDVQLPHLKKLHAAFEKGGGFAIIGLSLDADPETTRKYAAIEKLSWTQGFLGDWSQSAIRAEYGIATIPRLVLIGRDGRILVKDIFNAQGIQGVVAEALAKKEEL